VNLPNAQVTQPITFAELPSNSKEGAVIGILQGNSTANPLHAVKATVSVCVGSAEVTVGSLLAARENQVLTLDRSFDAPVDLMLNGQVIARGELVAVEGVFGIKITELPIPLAP
jgi:flagellar motor switch protein FliN